MGKLKNAYNSFLDDIEKNIKNKDDLEYIKKRFASFSEVVLNEMDYIVSYKEEEMKKLESKQNKIDNQMAQMQQVIDNIERDIYSEDGFDFEIICPYCNYEFIIDVDEDKTEIECPECRNIIELDWSGNVEDDQQGCSGNCHGCHDCDEDDDM